MRTAVLVILALVLVAQCSAAKLRSKQPQHKQVDIKTRIQELKGESTYADTLFSAILMQLEKGSKTDEVITLITEAINNTVLQHTNLSNLKTTKLGAIDGDIGKINGKLSTYRTDLSNTITTIGQLNDDIKALDRQIKAVSGEIDVLNERKTMIKETRKQDITNFMNRQERDGNAIKALDAIIPMLEDMANGSGTQLLQKSQSEIDAALEKIPKNHPIEMLVQMSTKFNEAKLKVVIGKLKDINEAIKASKADDELKEAQSEGRFRALIKEVEGLIDRKIARLVTIKGNKSAKEIELNNQENHQETVEKQIKDEETNLANAQALRELTEKNYNARIQETQEAIDALKKAKGIIEGGEKNLESQEKDQAAQAAAQAK